MNNEKTTILKINQYKQITISFIKTFHPNLDQSLLDQQADHIRF